MPYSADMTLAADHISNRRVRDVGALSMPADTMPASSRDIAALTQPLLVRLAAYWQSLREDARLPARRDIDPAAIVRAIPFVALIDVDRRTPLEMTYRLVGTELARWVGRDNTGRSVRLCYREELGADWDIAVRDYERAAWRGEPVRRWNHGVRPNGLLFEYERILLPLAADGRTVDGLMLGLVPR